MPFPYGWPILLVPANNSPYLAHLQWPLLYIKFLYEHASRAALPNVGAYEYSRYLHLNVIEIKHNVNI